MEININVTFWRFYCFLKQNIRIAMLRLFQLQSSAQSCVMTPGSAFAEFV